MTWRLGAQTDKTASQSRAETPESDWTEQPQTPDKESSTESTSSSGSDSGDDATESDSDSLQLDQVFEILKNSRRRQTLHYLMDNGGKATLSDLAEHIAANENGLSVEEITSSQRKRVYVGLYQCHLPKMDDMGVIEFEKNRGNIERGPNASQLEPYLEQTADLGWHRLYLGITAIGIGLFAVSVLGSAPFGLTPVVVLGAMLAAMTVCSLVHSRQ